MFVFSLLVSLSYYFILTKLLKYQEATEAATGGVLQSFSEIIGTTSKNGVVPVATSNIKLF